MILTVVALPAVEPVSLAELKGHLRVTHDDENAYLGALIATVRAGIEAERCLAMIDQTLGWTRHGFPPASDAWRLPRGPVRAGAAVSVTWLDAAGAPQTLAASAWRLVPADDTPFLTPVGGWPETEGLASVTFVAGFGDEAAAVPAPLRHAILVRAAALYADRERADLTAVSRSLFSPYGRIPF